MHGVRRVTEDQAPALATNVYSLSEPLQTHAPNLLSEGRGQSRQTQKDALMSAYYRVVQGTSRMKIWASTEEDARFRASTCGFKKPDVFGLFDQVCDHGTKPNDCGICSSSQNKGNQ